MAANRIVGPIYLLWLACLVGANPAWGDVPVVGHVETVTGMAFGTVPDGAKSAKEVDDCVVRDEELETAARSSLVVQLIDDTMLTLGAETRLQIDDMVFDPDTRRGSALVDLAAGAFHFVSGQLSKRDVRLETPLATIGIRGTEFALRLKADGRLTIGVIEGTVEVTTKRGSSMLVAEASSVHIGDGSSISTQVAGVVLTGDPAVDRGIPMSLARMAPPLWHLAPRDQPVGGTPRTDILPAGDDKPKGKEEPDEPDED